MSRATEKPDFNPQRTGTVIGAHVVVRGDIEGVTDLHIEEHARVLGKVSVAGLVLEQSAEIDGPVQAEAAVIGGFVNGSVEAQAVEVKGTARVTGDITYTNLRVESGARIAGRLILDDDSEATTAKAPDDKWEARVRSELADAGKEPLVRMTGRLRRASE